ncbi:DUF5018 domain-containing protein [Marinilabiliaceae bacterium ANBcel2]|nr:DUF5018 domain-containing protein [Marinilabiliaceae bacterium ANBcel2]
MKKYIITILVTFSLIFFKSCESPEDFSDAYTDDGVQLIIASFMDGSGEFHSEGELPYDNIITIPFPYYYPEESTNEVDISKMRLTANLPNNVSISPSLSVHDLRDPVDITVTAADGTETEHQIVADVRKSSKAQILDFSFVDVQLSGIVLEEHQVIGFVPGATDMSSVSADVRISHHASISPDPAELRDYSEPVTFTVTAHDGTEREYKVREVTPSTVASGIRSGSATQLFARRLKADVGIDVDHLTGGMAVTNDYVVLNTRDQNSIYLDAQTGENLGEIDLGDVKGGLTNFYSTADEAGNIVICNLSPHDGPFKIWTVDDVNSQPEPFLEWDEGYDIGRKLSVKGDLKGDAIITGPILGDGVQDFARWVVTGGELVSETPEIVTMSGLERGWTTRANLVHTSATDTESDYFVASYSDNTFAWVNGATNEVRAKLDEIDRNYIMESVDHVEFNNSQFVATNHLNSFTWGSADQVWLMDVSSIATFEGSLTAGDVDAVVWQVDRGLYGGNSVTPPVNNANGTADVAMTVSDDGYFLYLYFMFTNGYVVGYQFDCLDLDNIEL